MSNQLNALKAIEKDLISLKHKAENKLAKELDKQSNKYITFKGESCYTHEDIDDMYICDMCTLAESEKAHERLDKRLSSTGNVADTEQYIKIVRNLLYNIQCEIADVENQNGDNENEL